MWCRTILTAVAISYVICMLLWSGLQKEDLDAKTLEKLGRYNVNIDDMNNEKQRKDCLSQHATEPQKEAFETFTNTEGIQNYVSKMYPKVEKLFGTKFDDTAVVQHEDKNKSKGYFDPTLVIAQKLPDLGNVTKDTRNKAAIKIEYDLQNQEDVESVMNVWTKLTRYNATVITTLPTTATPITNTEQGESHNAKNGMTTVQAETHNNGYVHSREMEFISRMLAEYLASQTVPTSTQRVPSKKVFPNDKEKPNPVNEQRYEINNKNNVPQNNLRLENVIYNSLLDGTKNMPFDVAYDSAQLIKRVLVTPHTKILKNEPKVRKSVPVKKNNPLGFLFNILQMKSDLYNNGVLIPETESTSQSFKLLPIKSNEQKEKRQFDNLLNLFPIMNFVNKNFSKDYIMNNDKSTIATIKANTWESVPLSNERINKEYKALPIGNKDNTQLQKLYEQLKAAPSSIIKMRSINTNGDETMDNFESERMQKYVPKSVMYPSSESTNNQVIEMSTGFNKLVQNENIQLLTNQNDGFKADSGIISKWGPNYNSVIMESINNFDGDKGQRTPNIVKGWIPTKHESLMSLYKLQAEQANMIKDIAEKVKQMVIRQMKEETTTVSVTTTSTTTSKTTATPTMAAPTTSAPTTTSTTAKTLSDKPSASFHQEFTQTNQVIQKLMEIFKELKADKNASKLARQVPQNTITVSHGTRKPPPLPIRPNPQVAASSNPYFNILKPKQASSYTSRIVVPINSIAKPPRNKAPQYTPLLNVQPSKEYHLDAITMQTNSDEIAPLVIPMSKPLKHINQNIVVTTTGPADKLKQDHEQISIKQIEAKLRNPTKAKHREELQHQPDVSTKHGRLADVTIRDDSRDHNFYKSKYMNREKQWYNHEFNRETHNNENSHLDMSRFSEFGYLGRLSHLQHLGRPRGLNRPGFNKPTNHGDEQSVYTNYDHQPRYEATKFHEKLEKPENWPDSSWKDLKVPSESNYDEISGRQQMPLMKVKQRTRFDDSHFTNFLKSQQKVTDMLEKILANNVKNSPPSGHHSVETL